MILSILAAALLMSATAVATDYDEDDAEVAVEAPFGAGTLDITLAAGLGNLLYPHIEPGVDLGLVNLGASVALSLGGVVDLGYCLLCGFVSSFSGYDISSWYINPMGRALLHFGSVAQMLDEPGFDVYIGAMAGPAFYTLSSSDGANSFTASVTTFLLGPLVGLRYSLDDTNSWFIFGEGRLLLEFGFSEITLRSSDGQSRTYENNFGRGGNDAVFGLGRRY
ncbi:MAG: hypothetical protein H0U74_00495 [Bradymonadaceae bacterium]|nr:hypothetical protein [Lujinxingiaceae bacterium]